MDIRYDKDGNITDWTIPWTESQSDLPKEFKLIKEERNDTDVCTTQDNLNNSTASTIESDKNQKTDNPNDSQAVSIETNGDKLSDKSHRKVSPNLTVRVTRDYYDEGTNIFASSSFTAKPGVTVLIGCNGIGKTTLLTIIKESCKKKDIPCLYFNGQRETADLVSNAEFFGDIEMMARGMTSSEGELLNLSLGKYVSQMRSFILKHTGVRKDDAVPTDSQAIDEDNSDSSKEIVFLLDAADSGYSIDNVLELKKIFELAMQDANTHGASLFIIVAANSYEMAHGEQCYNVATGKHVKVRSYERFKKLVIESREIKNARYEQR